jgi:hypothetical protein
MVPTWWGVFAAAWTVAGFVRWWLHARRGD